VDEARPTFRIMR